MRRSAILLFATTLSRALNVPDRRVLSGALAQAASRQARVRAALEHELAGAGALPPAASAASLEKQRRRAELIPLRLAEVQRAEGRIRVFEARLGMDEDLAELRAEIEADEDLGPILRDHDPVAHARAREPRGRPAGFDGLVLESPRGVPVLVGRQGALTDEAMRRAASGRDRWYQVRDGRGARVLLRTSMARGLDGSRACEQFAADVAAWCSDSRDVGEDDEDEYVEVMVTDSRHVAKRGTRVGQMKDSKRLGVVRARPRAVADVVRAAQDGAAAPVWKILPLWKRNVRNSK